MNSESVFESLPQEDQQLAPNEKSCISSDKIHLNPPKKARKSTLSTKIHIKNFSISVTPATRELPPSLVAVPGCVRMIPSRFCWIDVVFASGSVAAREKMKKRAAKFLEIIDVGSPVVLAQIY